MTPIHPDEGIFYNAAMWQLNRKRAELRWAEMDAADYFGARDADDHATPSEEIASMLRALEILATSEPETIRGARVMLHVVFEILATREITEHDEINTSFLAKGPILRILDAVRDALENADGEMVIRKCHEDYGEAS